MLMHEGLWIQQLNAYSGQSPTVTEFWTAAFDQTLPDSINPIHKPNLKPDPNPNPYYRYNLKPCSYPKLNPKLNLKLNCNSI